MRRAALSALLVAGSLLLQLTVVNRLPLPGGGAPDLVLLVVIALALCGGPQTGMLTGFCAGLSLDLAPPASQLIGEYALVFCVVGYGCGKLRGALGRSALLPLIAAATAAAAGEALYAGLGLVLDPAQVTRATVRQVLPPSVLYDVVISSPMMVLVMLASRWVNDRAGAGSPEPRSQQPGIRQSRSPVGRPRTPGFHPARFQPGRPRSAWGGPARSTSAWTKGAGARSRGRGSTASWSAGTAPGTGRPGAGRPARSPGFRPAPGFRGGSAGGGRPQRPSAGQPVSLRMHAGRRRDVSVRFRPGRAVGFRPGRAARFGSGRRSGMSIRTFGRAGRRSSAWRIGGRRAGGSR